ncbi:hypothetical protein BHE74_00013490 [Ensete ventricosum]|nr:hypothetical protein BHE74_00013490 [Ensete ventricosum]
MGNKKEIFFPFHYGKRALRGKKVRKEGECMGLGLWKFLCGVFQLCCPIPHYSLPKLKSLDWVVLGPAPVIDPPHPPLLSSSPSAEPLTSTHEKERQRQKEREDEEWGIAAGCLRPPSLRHRACLRNDVALLQVSRRSDGGDEKRIYYCKRSPSFVLLRSSLFQATFSSYRKKTMGGHRRMLGHGSISARRSSCAEACKLIGKCSWSNSDRIDRSI